MFSINNNNIRITKGDSAAIYFNVVDLDNLGYTIQSTDVITLTVRKNEESATASITKTLTDDYHFVFNHSDTANLDPGLYVYDVQLVNADDNYYTVIPLSFFEILSEVSA